MKSIILLSSIFFSCISFNTQNENTKMDLEVLIGTWSLDMSPQDPDDDNFAMMKITEVSEHSFKGEFYREGVEIRNAQINTQLGKIYAALVSGDRSGDYHSTFYYEEGKLHGTTHAVDRDFLSVWIATKQN